MSPRTTSRSFPAPALLSLPTLSALLLGLPSLSSAFDCKEVVASDVKFNLKELGGPHVVRWEEEPDLDHEVQYKYNFTLDICEDLKKEEDSQTGCHEGTRICAIREETYLVGDRNATIQPIEIAGTYGKDEKARTLNPQIKLLHDSKSKSEDAQTGVTVELHGGRFPFDTDKKGLEQQAVIDFVCDKARTGLEGLEKQKQEEKDDETTRSTAQRRDDKKKEDEHSLQVVSYKQEDGPDDKKIKTLHLEWRTKHACEEDAPDAPVSSHWGFFTWFIIIFFLAMAAYLIFGSWLNYNRYGARGWDLLPHGDTIRDIPYILKDCLRSVKNTVQGGGSRGGYSAV
ncbi:hypothetical protein M011DRAFT_465837 [Sporormia fimetaria CBS 119925]|uniref:Autophagy-related protein 27 n=1 Tax=Sporormia fimetaria CBS 119925 TaxID=1340428 RepID=A0A6A6VFM9_9PLEO|nr:hypothetical protein M011DRAFT_465837 [Sporormia fimetaria CBS 119925]